jgi:hypothetical protein
MRRRRDKRIQCVRAEYLRRQEEQARAISQVNCLAGEGGGGLEPFEGEFVVGALDVSGRGIFRNPQNFVG